MSEDKLYETPTELVGIQIASNQLTLQDLIQLQDETKLQENARGHTGEG